MECIFRRYMDSMNMFHFCAIAFVGHVHIERNLFMSLDRTSASCDLCALESIQDLNYNGLMEWSFRHLMVQWLFWYWWRFIETVSCWLCLIGHNKILQEICKKIDFFFQSNFVINSLKSIETHARAHIFSPWYFSYR